MEGSLKPEVDCGRVVNTMLEPGNHNALAKDDAIQGSLSLHASGRTTVIVIIAGDGFSHSVPIDEGYGLPYPLALNLMKCDLEEYTIKNMGRTLYRRCHRRRFDERLLMRR